MERLPEVILRKVTLSNPALFYSSLTSPSNRRRIEAFKHQFQTLCHAMLSRPVRILIADEIGLGKTIQALAIARYLELQGEAKKILILVPKILREQWKQEIRRLGGKPVVITNGSEVERKLLRKATFNNAAEYFVVSIDLAKSQNHSEKFSAIDWDLLIVDEVHNVTYNTQRYNFLKSLIEKSKEDLNIVFLSATPHRGNPKDYIERLRLLDPTLTADWNALDSEKFYRRTHGVLVFRRTKKVVNDLERERDLQKVRFQRCDS
ncbi:DEAD/DEAH box helicase [Thermotoga neapolitana]|uniref:DEAD/DEAH box helicase n=1 Tax=Thermotoga neapolitana TaxID=2337 RepID=UPI000B0C82DF|nr:DEAD/DEAH box helicase [Thermotoga neapolitana]